MDVDDRLLPAAPHLTSPHAFAVVAPVVEASGGTLHELRPDQVLYRPGRELVVAYGARVSWMGSSPVDETIMAGTTPEGAPAGTVEVRAEDLSVGVWRYPFDPVLPGLERAVVPGPVADLLRVPPTDLQLAVRTFRPGKRAVVHARWRTGEAYVKVLAPDRVAGIVARHRALRAAGVPVPEVLAVDEGRGLLAMTALPGTELRHRLLAETGPVPSGDDLVLLLDALASVEVSHPRRRPSLLASAPHHAALLRRVLPTVASRLDELLAPLSGPLVEESTVTIHGDLHDAQMRVDGDGRIVGVLDIDDVGPGDPLDDPARVVAHLIALSIVHPAGSRRVRGHADRLLSDLERRFDPAELRARISAALVGLATGPFRVQATEWRAEVARILAAARQVSRDRAADERSLRRAS